MAPQAISGSPILEEGITGQYQVNTPTFKVRDFNQDGFYDILTIDGQTNRSTRPNRTIPNARLVFIPGQSYFVFSNQPILKPLGVQLFSDYYIGQNLLNPVIPSRLLQVGDVNRDQAPDVIISQVKRSSSEFGYMVIPNLNLGRSVAEAIPVGSGMIGRGGYEPEIGFEGKPVSGNLDFALNVRFAAPNRVIEFIWGVTPFQFQLMNIPMEFVPDPLFVSRPMMTSAAPQGENGSGYARVPLPIPASIPSGTQLFLKWVVYDPSPQGGLVPITVTKSLKVTIGP